jgi:hypothetical protein
VEAGIPASRSDHCHPRPRRNADLSTPPEHILRMSQAVPCSGRSARSDDLVRSGDRRPLWSTGSELDVSLRCDRSDGGRHLLRQRIVARACVRGGRVRRRFCGTGRRSTGLLSSDSRIGPTRFKRFSPSTGSQPPFPDGDLWPRDFGRAQTTVWTSDPARPHSIPCGPTPHDRLGDRALVRIRCRRAGRLLTPPRALFRAWRRWHRGDRRSWATWRPT